jgi:hypothetical protein
MAKRVYRVGPQERWRARMSGWWVRSRRPRVWAPLLVALAFFVSSWRLYADQAALARRAVPASATIQKVYHATAPHGIGQASVFRVEGLLSYQVHGRTIYTPVWLTSCRDNRCMPYWRARQGHTAKIAYDPRNVHRVELGRVAKPFPNLALTGLGIIFLGAGINNLFPGPGTPLERPRRRPPTS